jgi:hypothetical protein
VDVGGLGLRLFDVLLGHVVGFFCAGHLCGLSVQ